MLHFNDLLRSEDIDPSSVNVILHSPREQAFAKVLPTLFQERPAALIAFQSSHNRPAQRALQQGRELIASFVKTGENRLVFAGLYSNNGSHNRPMREIWNEPEIQFLHDTYGLDYGQGIGDPESTYTWFDIREHNGLAALKGRLVIEARMTPTYVRLAENLEAPVVCILEQGVYDIQTPNWSEMMPSAAIVRALPTSWAAALREWRGIYLIIDVSDGARYVGSAYGESNLLGRWREHVAGGRGITRELRARDPINFRFSILQLLAPDANQNEVIRLEHSYMDRIHTREFGLNT